MKIEYFRQKASESFRIIEKINVSVKTVEGRNTIQIYPFKVESEGKVFEFNGISGVDIDLLGSSSVILGRIDQSGCIVLSMYKTELFQDTRDVIDQLGILIYISPERIMILDHSWEV